MAIIDTINIANNQIIGGRDNQQDYFATHFIQEGLLVLLADGMGGYKGGEIASQTAVKSFAHLFQIFFNDFNIPDLLQKVLFDTQAIISQTAKSNAELSDMGTTFIAAYFKENQLYYISVGDSPMYRHVSGDLVRINENHSLAGEFEKEVQKGTMSEEEAKTHPDRHIITSALMSEDIPLIDAPREPLDFKKDDIFVFASDGIHTIEDIAIKEFISSKTNLHVKGEALINAIEAKNKPHQDNTTIILVEHK